MKRRTLLGTALAGAAAQTRFGICGGGAGGCSARQCGYRF